MKTSKINRKYWLDIAKGIAIFLMVIGHTSIPNAVSNFIYAFHMPLFFIASGLASNYDRHTWDEYVKHKSYTIMLPFLSYSVIVILLQYSIGALDATNFLKTGWGGYALWFAPILYFASILTMLICRIRNNYIRLAMMLSMLLMGYGLCHYKIVLPWSLSTVPYATFLILVGNELKYYSRMIETENHNWVIAAAFIVTVVISHFYRLELAWNNIIPIIPLTVGAIVGTLMIFRLSVWIEQHMKRCSSILQAIGKETYILVAFSQVIIMYINHFFMINVLWKYVILVVVLIFLKYAKDWINRLVKVKIL